VPLALDPSSLLVHFVAVALLLVGIVLTRKHQAANQPFSDRFIALGPTFFAVPFAVFGMQHFTAIGVVATAVPPWMPARMFWAYFVGAALVAASLSIITRVKSDLAAPLLALTLFLFVLMIYLPGFVRNPRDRFVLAAGFRDLALSGGALSLSGTLLVKSRPRLARCLAAIGRWFFAIAIVVFGIEHFPHPEFAPGVPLELMMPAWIPGHSAWAYLTGGALVVFGLGILVTNRGRLAAIGLGITYLVLVIFIYMPMEIVHPSNEISGELDYVVDTLVMSGAALLVAGAIGSRDLRRAPGLEPSRS
jgi:uncharacterized membrane protein